MNNIPECARESGCARCHEILDVSVVDSPQEVQAVKVSYVPDSKYQFVVEFDFGNVFVNSLLSFTVRINRNFSGCFTEDDLSQQISWYIDPMTLIHHCEPDSFEEPLLFDGE